MRTTYINEGTANEVKITSPDEFTYVFQPNYTTVELGSNFSASEAVKLEYNGILLERNCINRKCTFDLSVFFELYFSYDAFNFSYLADDDDTTFGTFGIKFTAGIYDTTIDFGIKWGALQADDVQNYDIKFPYWKNMPLFVNGDFEHDAIELGGVAGAANLKKIINRPDGGDFVYELKKASATVNKVTFIEETCNYNGHYLMWIDSHGRAWHYMFMSSREFLPTTAIETKNSIPYFPQSLAEMEFGREKIIEKKKQRSFKCYANVDKSIYPIIQSIADSLIVRYYVNSVWIGINIPDMTITPKAGGMIEIEFEVKLPEDYTQKL